MRIAEELGVDAEIVLYIKTPPDEKTLRSIIAKLEDPVTDLVRRDLAGEEARVYEYGETIAASDFDVKFRLIIEKFIM